MDTDKDNQKKTKLKDYCNLCALFCLGTVNNLSLIAVNSLAQQIVEEFDHENLLGLVVWFNTGITCITRFLHSMFMLWIPVPVRILLSTVAVFIGDLGLAFSTYTHIALAFIFIVVIGSFTFMEESVLMGYMSRFPPSTVVGLSSGLGFSAMLAAAICILFQAGALSVRDEFLILSPSEVLSALFFFFWLQKPTAAEIAAREKQNSSARPAEESVTTPPTDGAGTSSAEDTQPATDVPNSVQTPPDSDSDDDGNSQKDTQSQEGKNESDSASTTPADTTQPIIATDEESGKAEDSTTTVEQMSVSYTHTLKLTWFYALLIGWTYFCTYIVLSACMDLAVPKSWRKAEGAAFYVKNSFTIANFCVQTGVFVARSTLSLLKIKKVWILGLIDLANIILFIVQVAKHFITQDYVWFLFADAILVGLVSGSMWVNCFYLINLLPINAKEKDFASNICLVMAPVGISLAAIVALLFKNVIFDDVK